MKDSDRHQVLQKDRPLFDCVCGESGILLRVSLGLIREAKIVAT